MSTELNALAAGSAAIASAAIDNETALDLFCDLELVVDFVTAPTDGGLVKCYFVRTVDGTNYEDAVTGASEFPPANGYVGSFRLRNDPAAQRMIIPEANVPVRNFKPYLVNETNQAFPATGTTLKGYFYRYQSS